MARRKGSPQKAAMRKMMRDYLKNNDISIKDGTDVNGIMRMHTSYGDMDVAIPRDRNGDYEPQLIKKYQNTITQDMEEKILSMYGGCLSKNRDSAVYHPSDP